MGSDEFAMVVFSDSNIKEDSTLKAENIASELIRHFNNPIKVDFHELIINFSVGIYTFNHLCSIHDIIRYADISLYQAKSSGHNTILRYTENMKENGQKKLLLKNELVKAIQNDELDIYLQPQYNNDGALYGAESLVRWNKDGEFISPVDFIPLAEETGLIKLIGNQVLYKTCEFFEENIQYLPKSFRKFSINVSPIQFYQPNFIEDFIEIFEKFDIPPSRMEIEITENVFFKERHESIKKMYQLLEYGFSFAVDDFGTGYSSLSYLIDLPFNKLKIDKAFIQRISESDRYKKLVESIINICNHMNFDVIAEGIENQEDFEFLKEHGCKYYQGFYFSKPLSRKDFCESQLLKLEKS
jgi:EAL domain-containing protein (putative c-di-GMP-specific phosphodiesterase class I)